MLSDYVTAGYITQVYVYTLVITRIEMKRWTFPHDYNSNDFLCGHYYKKLNALTASENEVIQGINT